MLGGEKVIEGFAKYLTDETWTLELGDVPGAERRQLILAARSGLLDV